MNILSKLAFVFTNLDNLKQTLVKTYVLVKKVEPALQLVNDLVPDETKAQKGLDKIFPVFAKVTGKVLFYIESIANFFKIELPTVIASSNDPIDDLEDLLK